MVETLADVKGMGPSFAEKAYDELEVRSLDDLIQAAKDNRLQTLRGIGAAKEKAILEAALEKRDAGEGEPAPQTHAPAPEAKTAKKAKAEPVSGKPEEKKERPRTEPVDTGPARSAKTDGTGARPTEARSTPERERERERSSQGRNGAPERGRPSIPGLLVKLTRRLIGRILR